jgi:ubiquinone/menaquinone biosynthesis C-methylase UbiE
MRTLQIRDTNKASVIEFYEKEAQSYDEKRSSSAAGKFIWGTERGMILNLCEDIKRKKILDLGAGTGRYSIELAKNGANIVSYDPAKAMIKVINEKSYKENVIERISFVQGDGKKLPFKDSSFDGIICMYVLSHLSTYKDVLREMKRVIKPDGFIIANFPNILSTYLPAAIYVNVTHHAVGKRVYSKFFTKNKVKKTLESAGFVIEEVRGSIFLHPRFVPEKLYNMLSTLENFTSNSFLKNFSLDFIVKAVKNK